MSLSRDRKAIADRAIQQTFERASVAWRAIPHWDTHDPGQVYIRNDVIFTFAGATTGQPLEPQAGPLGIVSLEPRPKKLRFEITLAQATAPAPDALLGSVIPQAAALAREFDDAVLSDLITSGGTAPRTVSAAANDWHLDWPVQYHGQRAQVWMAQAINQLMAPRAQPSLPEEILSKLLRGRRQLEDSGYRAPSCLIASDEHYSNLNKWVRGEPAIRKVLAGANVDSVYRVTQLDRATVDGAPRNVTLMLGRMQEFPNGSASGVSSGEEPVDLAISVPPSLEVVGETATGNIQLAVRIRFATRVKDERGVVVFSS
jgi:hypothetical protein